MSKDFAFRPTIGSSLRGEQSFWMMRAARFRAAQREARSAGRGVCGRCVHEGACDPAYPDRCIPPPPPDLDCSDIDQRRFTVLPPDPHTFDGDDNDVGCEMV